MKNKISLDVKSIEKTFGKTGLFVLIASGILVSPFLLVKSLKALLNPQSWVFESYKPVFGLLWNIFGCFMSMFIIYLSILAVRELVSRRSSEHD